MNIRKNMNFYINTDLLWTIPTRLLIIIERVISSNNVIYQINTNKINLLKTTKWAFQFFQFSNILNFYLGLLILKNSNSLIVCHFQKYSRPAHIEKMFFRTKSPETKPVICCSCNSYKNLISELLQKLAIATQFCSEVYHMIALIGGCNAEILETNMASFREIYELKNHIKELIYF